MIQERFGQMWLQAKYESKILKSKANGNIKHMVMLAHMRMFTTCRNFKDGIPRIPFLGFLLLVKCIMDNHHKKSITIVLFSSTIHHKK
jgi:hypothetical protein